MHGAEDYESLKRELFDQLEQARADYRDMRYGRFEESKHPRADDGKFKGKGQGEKKPNRSEQAWLRLQEKHGKRPKESGFVKPEPEKGKPKEAPKLPSKDKESDKLVTVRPKSTGKEFKIPHPSASDETQKISKPKGDWKTIKERVLQAEKENEGKESWEDIQRRRSKAIIESKKGSMPSPKSPPKTRKELEEGMSPTDKQGRRMSPGLTPRPKTLFPTPAMSRLASRFPGRGSSPGKRLRW